MPGKVKVKIISGKNLPIMDRSNDTTDAYVEIKLGNITYKTEVCRRTLHPRWNTDWYRFELDDSELQDEPLQIRLMDHDTYSANDAIGKVYLNLNPLLLPAAGQLALGDNNPHHEISGWIPVFDTMHGIRGEVNVTVKVELFSDFNKFRQSSCGIKFFYSQCIPRGYQVKVINGFVEELIVDDDPEYQWIDKIRTPRASNEARQTLFFKLSGELQRKIGVKAINLGGNAVIGYKQCFDLEGESGIVARGIGTAVTLVKAVLLQNAVPESREENAEKYLKFVGDGKRFSLGPPVHSHYRFKVPVPITPFLSTPITKRIPKKLSQRLHSSLDSGNISSISSPSVFQDDSTLKVLLNQEEKRGESAISRSFQKFRHSQKSLSRKMIALRSKLGDGIGEEAESSSNKRSTFKRATSDSGAMAAFLARSVIQATSSLGSILESQAPPKDEDTMESLKPLSNLLSKSESQANEPDNISDGSDSTSDTTTSDSEYDDSEKNNNDVETISNIVSNVEKLQRRTSKDNFKKQYSLPTIPLGNFSTESLDTISELSSGDSYPLKPNFPKLLLEMNKRLDDAQVKQRKQGLLIETSFGASQPAEFSENTLVNPYERQKTSFSKFPKNHSNFCNIDFSTADFNLEQKPDNLLLVAPIENVDAKEDSMVNSAMKTMLLERLNCLDIGTPDKKEKDKNIFVFDDKESIKVSNSEATDYDNSKLTNLPKQETDNLLIAPIENVDNSEGNMVNSEMKTLLLERLKCREITTPDKERDRNTFVFDDKGSIKVSKSETTDYEKSNTLSKLSKQEIDNLLIAPIENVDNSQGSMVNSEMKTLLLERLKCREITTPDKERDRNTFVFDDEEESNSEATGFLKGSNLSKLPKQEIDNLLVAPIENVDNSEGNMVDSAMKTMLIERLNCMDVATPGKKEKDRNTFVFDDKGSIKVSKPETTDYEKSNTLSKLSKQEIDNLLIAPIENVDNSQSSMVNSAMRTMLIERLNCMDVATPGKKEKDRNTFVFDGKESIKVSKPQATDYEKSNTLSKLPKQEINNLLIAPIENVDNSQGSMVDSAMKTMLIERLNCMDVATPGKKEKDRNTFVFDGKESIKVSKPQATDYEKSNTLSKLPKQEINNLLIAPIENVDNSQSSMVDSAMKTMLIERLNCMDVATPGKKEKDGNTFVSGEEESMQISNKKEIGIEEKSNNLLMIPNQETDTVLTAPIENVNNEKDNLVNSAMKTMLLERVNYMDVATHCQTNKGESTHTNQQSELPRVTVQAENNTSVKPTSGVSLIGKDIYKYSQENFPVAPIENVKISDNNLVKSALSTMLLEKLNCMEIATPSVLNIDANQRQNSLTFEDSADKIIHSKELVEMALETLLIEKVGTAEATMSRLSSNVNGSDLKDYSSNTELKSPDINPKDLESTDIENISDHAKPTEIVASVASDGIDVSDKHFLTPFLQTILIDNINSLDVNTPLASPELLEDMAENSNVNVCEEKSPHNLLNDDDIYSKHLVETAVKTILMDEFNTVGTSVFPHGNLVSNSKYKISGLKSCDTKTLNGTEEMPKNNNRNENIINFFNKECFVKEMCEKVVENSSIFSKDSEEVNNLTAPVDTGKINSEPKHIVKTAMQLILLEKVNSMGAYTPPASPSKLKDAGTFNMPESENYLKVKYKPSIVKSHSFVNIGDGLNADELNDKSDTFSCFSDTDLTEPTTKKQVLKKKRKFSFFGKLNSNKKRDSLKSKEPHQNFVSRMFHPKETFTDGDSIQSLPDNPLISFKTRDDNQEVTSLIAPVDTVSFNAKPKQMVKTAMQLILLEKLNTTGASTPPASPIIFDSSDTFSLKNQNTEPMPQKRSIPKSFSLNNFGGYAKQDEFDFSDQTDSFSCFSDTDLTEPITQKQVLKKKRKFGFFKMKFNNNSFKRAQLSKIFHSKHEEKCLKDTETQTSTEFLNSTPSPSLSTSSNTKGISKIQTFFPGNADLVPGFSHTNSITNTACVTPNRQNTSPVHQESNGPGTSRQIKEGSPERIPSKQSYSPIKLNASALLYRRSSDSDLSITPKGNSLTGSDKSCGHTASMHMRNHYIRKNGPQDNFEMMEYPFLTMNSFPTNFIVQIGSSVSSKSVKVLERISNLEEPESRDSWWSEVRMEIRAHARSLNCNAVLGYTESACIYEDVCVLSASGTAAVVDLNNIAFAFDEENVNVQRSADKDAAKRTIYESSEHNGNQTPLCQISHLPYDDQNVPSNAKVSKCPMCSKGRVPEVLMVTIEPPDNLPSVGKGCFIECHVSRPVRDCRGESIAREISDGLPFLEYELHRLLVNKLKIKGMNAIFSLKIRYSMGEKMLLAIASGTAIYLSSLHAPTLPVLVSDRVSDEKIVAGLQEMLIETIRKNREIYEIKDDGFNKPNDDEIEEKRPSLDLAFGNKDCSVLEMDDPEDAEVVTLLMEDKVPDGFHVVNTESVPGLDDLEIVKNLQMFIQIYRAKISPNHNLQKHFHRLLQTVYFKLRRMVPCALCDLQFRVDIPDSDEIQLCIIGMALGLGKKVKKRTPIAPKNTEDDLIFKLDEDTPQDTPIHGIRSNSTSLKYRPNRSPLKLRNQSLKQRHIPHKERHGVDITPLSYVPGGNIEQYLGNLNFFFIRETTSIREEGGLSGFIHSFITEVLAIVRSHVSALGGNALVAFFMTECVLNHSLHKNQGQCLINVGGDVVSVSYQEDA